jgi:hypothetical protein
VRVCSRTSPYWGATGQAMDPRRDKVCILAVVAGCDARRRARRSASTASGWQRSSAPATASKDVQLIPARVLTPD